MKLTVAVRSAAQPSQMTFTASPGRWRQNRLVDEEAHLQVSRRQQRQHRLAGRDHFADAEIDLLDAAVTGLETLRRASRVCEELTRAWAVRSAVSAASKFFCVPASVLSSMRARS